MKKKILRWLTPLLLFCIAGTQIFLVFTYNLTPWKGGGFGMFAYIDRMNHRPVHLTITNSQGHFIANPSLLIGNKGISQIQSLPTKARIKDLAELALKTNWIIDSTKTVNLDLDFLEAKSQDSYSYFLVNPASDDGNYSEGLIYPTEVRVAVYKLKFDVHTGLTQLVKINSTEIKE